MWIKCSGLFCMENIFLLCLPLKTLPCQNVSMWTFLFTCKTQMTCVAFPPPRGEPAHHHLFLGTHPPYSYIGLVLWLDLSNIKVNYSVGSPHSESSFFLRKLSNPHLTLSVHEHRPSHTLTHCICEHPTRQPPPTHTHHVYEHQSNSSFLKRTC